MLAKLQTAEREIVEFLGESESHVFRQRELERTLTENRAKWHLPKKIGAAEFLRFLLNHGSMRRLEFAFPHRKEVRYVWGQVPIESVLLTLKPGCHFSHYTAVQLHDLTEQQPRTVYLNHEQQPKPVPPAGLTQGRIDMAFRLKPRATRNVATVTGTGDEGLRVCLLNGKHTGYLGVEEREVTSPESQRSAYLRLTDLERTLIDIAVRPFYAGGVAEVLKAYVRAAERASVNRLAAMLRKLGHVYPYHQAIGFYLEAAGGYDPHTIELFRAGFEYEFDFHLTYGMGETEYVPRWRIHVPKGFSRMA